ncbi:hypothetical protein [Dactylosporangium darangshiense]|uniref:Yip1 domain-containing protein n=1 Tax=Dactylosporangium darangshiense TaxID=579108 RepID=A0ABP8DQR2_9ACTN
MSARLGRAIVYIAAAVMPDPDTRARYREQWLADVDGAAELGLSSLPVALGAAAAAVRLAATDPHSVTALMRAPLLPRVSPRLRRAFGIVQLAVAAPYLWAVVFYGYARLRLGVSHAELVGTPYDPKDLLVLWFPPFWAYTPVMLWLAVGGWTVASGLAPAGLVLAIGGQRAARWLPLTGTIAAAAVTALAVSTFGDTLRIWLLD